MSMASNATDMANLIASYEYGDPSYWDAFYAQAPAEGEESHDWLVDWTELHPILEPLLGHNFQKTVLHLGTGNSELPEQMHDAGYTCQSCVDVSESVIKHMASRNIESRPSIQWVAGDCTDLSSALPRSPFDMVIGKSLFDALGCSDQHSLQFATYMREAFCMTKPHGVFISVEFKQPRRMLPWFFHPAFRWQVQIVRTPNHRGAPSGNVVYICTKQPGMESLSDHWVELLAEVTALPTLELPCNDDTATLAAAANPCLVAVAAAAVAAAALVAERTNVKHDSVKLICE